MNNLNSYILLLAKYAPTIVKIIQTEGPVVEAFLKDLQAINAGQPISGVTVPVQTTTTKFPPA